MTASEITSGMGAGWTQETWDKYLSYMTIYGNCFIYLDTKTGEITVLSPEDYQEEADE